MTFVWRHFPIGSCCQITPPLVWSNISRSMKQRNLPCCILWSAFIQIQALWCKSLVIWPSCLSLTDWPTLSRTASAESERVKNVCPSSLSYKPNINQSAESFYITVFRLTFNFLSGGDLKWVVLNFPTGLLLQRLLKCASQNSNLGKDFPDFPSFKFHIFFQFAFNQFVHLMLGLGGHHKWTFEKWPWQLINPTPHLSLSVRYSTVDNLLLIVDKTNHII